jgi:cation diffusion facilitator family transporter
MSAVVSAAVPAALTRYAWLSIAAAVVTIALKSVAYLVTDSVGLLSDALESVVNLVAAIVTLVALHIAQRPADAEHEHGHDKAEYFASGVEGGLIFAAAALIVASAAGRLLRPVELGALDLGAVISAAASAVNFAVARVLLGVGRRRGSVALEADGHHLMTDVWTSVGVIAGILAVKVTGWSILDPLLAIGVALNILWTGARLVHQAGMGLLDTAVPAASREVLAAILERHSAVDQTRWHALRTRQAGARRFISVHVLVPGSWTVQRGHDLCERIEAELAATWPKTTVFTHLEPVDDAASFADQGLDRDPPAA